MMVAELQTAPWDKILFAELGDWLLAPGQAVLVKNETGVELASVLSLVEKKVADKDLTIIKIATADDWQNMLSAAERQNNLALCQQLIKSLALPMKLLDVRQSYDGARLTFAFVANGRIDFRELVKELTKECKKNIRLQQVGIRDEAKLVGDQGRCGRGLCCRQHLDKIAGVSSEAAEVQNLIGRGNERLSGACGRLMCCLAYEAEGYKSMSATLPTPGETVSVGNKRGVVVHRQVLNGQIDVKFKGEKGEDDYIVAVPWPVK